MEKNIWNILSSSFLYFGGFRLLIGFVTDKDMYSWKGYLFAVLLLLASMAQTLILGQYFHLAMRIGMHVRVGSSNKSDRHSSGIEGETDFNFRQLNLFLSFYAS